MLRFSAGRAGEWRTICRFWFFAVWLLVLAQTVAGVDSVSTTSANGGHMKRKALLHRLVKAEIPVERRVEMRDAAIARKHLLLAKNVRGIGTRLLSDTFAFTGEQRQGLVSDSTMSPRHKALHRHHHERHPHRHRHQNGGQRSGKRQEKRAKRSPLLLPSVTIASLVVHHAAPSTFPMHFEFSPSNFGWDLSSKVNTQPTAKATAMSGESKAVYGEESGRRRLTFALEEVNQFKVEIGNASCFGSIHQQSSFLLPEGGLVEAFLVASVDVDGVLYCSFRLFDVEQATRSHTTWLFLYNAVVDIHAYDVLALTQTGAPENENLYRVAAELPFHGSVEAELPYGKYDIKVVAPDTVRNRVGFKNARSILPSLSFAIGNGTSHSFVLQGVPGSTQFTPRLRAFPTVAMGPARRWPINLMVLNSDFMSDALELKVLGHRMLLPYGAGQSCKVDVIRGDTYTMEAGGDVTTRSFFFNVPYQGVCLVIPDRSVTRELEAFLECWSAYHFALVHGQALIITYHALVNFTRAVEVIIYDKSALHVKERHSLYSIGLLRLGRAQAAIVEVGTYELKVVPENVVADTDGFVRAKSLIQPTTLTLESARTYYASISGLHGSREVPRFQSIPPMSPGVRTERRDGICSSCEQCTYYSPVQITHVTPAAPGQNDATTNLTGVNSPRGIANDVNNPLEEPATGNGLPFDPSERSSASRLMSSSYYLRATLLLAIFSVHLLVH